MDPRPSYRYLVLSLVPLWVGCAQLPPQTQVVKQSGQSAPSVAEGASRPTESSAPARQSVVEREAGQSGVDSSEGQDVDPPAAVRRAHSAAQLPPPDGERLTLDDAKSLAMRLNPLLRQSQ